MITRDLDAEIAADQKAVAFRDCKLALRLLGGEGRQLDAWELINMVSAISCLRMGVYRLASVDAELALTPPNERSPTANLTMSANDTRADRNSLWHDLRVISGEPVLKYPNFRASRERA